MGTIPSNAPCTVLATARPPDGGVGHYWSVTRMLLTGNRRKRGGAARHTSAANYQKVGRTYEGWTSYDAVGRPIRAPIATLASCFAAGPPCGVTQPTAAVVTAETRLATRTGSRSG